MPEFALREVGTNTKRCPGCGEFKPRDDFPRNRRTKDGLAHYCKPCHNAKGAESRNRLHGSSRHYHLRRRYGIGQDDFDAILADQNGRCAICECELDVSAPHGRQPHVDHCHETGRVRGILCFNCNSGIGKFGDDPGVVLLAAVYLQKSKNIETREETWELATSVVLTKPVTPASPTSQHGKHPGPPG